MENKNEIIIQKLSNVLEELEFLNYNCPHSIGLKDCYIDFDCPHTIGLKDCYTDFDCVQCWIQALRIKELWWKDE